MYLYEKNKNRVNVYELKEDLEKISNYRRQQVETIPEGKRLLSAFTNNEEELTECGKNVSFYDLNYHQSGLYGGTVIHKLCFYDEYDKELECRVYINTEEKKRQLELLNKYYQSNTLRYTLKVENSKNKYLKYLLLTRINYHSEHNDKYKTMLGIINLTEDLYIFENFYNLFCQDAINKLYMDEDKLQKFIDLFNLNGPITTIDIGSILKADKFGLLDNGKIQIDSNINNSKKILSLKK